MSFLDHIHECNRWVSTDFLPFILAGERVGMLRRAFADELLQWPQRFRVEQNCVTWIGAPDGFDDRTAAMQETIDALLERGVISHLHGEQYPVTPGCRSDARLLIDRACAPYFGVSAFGQHINGYVRSADGLKMWIARRSADRRVFPLHLDNLVAGGLPWGIGLAENLRKECAEEADIPEPLADRAMPVSAVSYCRDSSRGLKPDVMYCYDLELPDGFEPRNTDGEVSAFYLWSVQRVLETVRDSSEFKLNCNLVIIDFLVRHGLIDPNDPDYLPIVQGLRSPLPTDYSLSRRGAADYH